MRTAKYYSRTLASVVFFAACLAVLTAAAQVPAPSNLAVVSPYDGQVDLVWTPNPTATAYQVSRELLELTSTPTPTPTGTLTPVPTNTPIAWIPSSAFSVPVGTPVFQDFQVTNGRSYFYQVSGMDSGGGIGLSAGVTGVPFSAPASIKATVQTLHANSLDLSWSVPLSTYPIASYNIYAAYSNSVPSPTPMSASALVTANPTPVATSLTANYSDQSMGVSTGFYVVLGIDSQGNWGVLPSLASNGASANSSLPPAAPQLSGYVPVTPTITPTYGIQLVWNGALASESVTEYQIKANGAAIATILVTPTPLPTYTFLDQTIAPVSSSGGKATTYSIVAISTVGSSSSNMLEQIIYRPLIPPPIKVTPNATQNAVTLTWNQGVKGTYGLAGYRLYKSLNGTPLPLGTPGTNTPTPFATIEITPSSTPTVMAVDTGVSTAHGLTYWVEPYDLVGRGGDPGFAATPVLILAPTPVSTVSAAGPVGNNHIDVSWSGGSSGFYGATLNYTINRVNVAAPTLTPVATVSAAQSTFTDFVPYFAGVSVAYKIGAVDAVGNTSTLSSISNSVALTAMVPPAIPQVNYTIGGVNSLTFSWLFNPVADNATSYSVFGPDWPTLTVTPTPIATVMASPTMAPYVNNSTTDWNNYAYYVEGTNAQGNGQPATFSSIAVPVYQVTAVTTPDARQMELSWKLTPGATPGIDNLVIYRGQSTPNIGYTPIATIPATSSNYTDTTASPGVNYSYIVTARLNGPPVAESPVSLAFTPSAPGTVLSWPNVPIGLSGAGGVTETFLSWPPNSASEAVLSYSIRRNGTPTVTVTPSPTLSIPFAETPGTLSTYQVIAQNASGSSDYSSSITILSIPSMTPTIGLTPPPGATPTPQAVWISGLIYPNDVAAYTLYRALDPAFTTGLTMLGSLSSPASFISGAGVTGETNYYKVVPNNGAGVTADFTRSHVMSIDLWPNPPTPVVFDGGPAAVTLSWVAPAGSSPATAYDVYRGTSPGGEVAIATGIPVPTTTYVDASVTPGVPYYYWMDSQGSGLTSVNTVEQSIIPGPAPVLSAASGPNQTILTWSPVSVPGSPITGYVVYREVLPSTVFAQVGSLIKNLATTTYIDSAVSDSTSYVYKVASYAPGSPTLLGSFSNPVTVAVLPQAPSQISAVSSNQTVQLRWNYQGTPNNTYTIERKLGTAPDTDFQTVRTGLMTLDFIDTGLLDKTFYTYRILVVDPQGLIGTSPDITALPAKPPVIDDNKLTLTQTQNGNTISWVAANSQPGDFDPLTMYPLGGYHVYRSSDGGGTYQLLNPVGTVLTTYTDNVSIINGSTFTYLVRAYDAPPDVNTSDPAMVHESLYGTVTAYPLSASTALDRNSLRPFGASSELLVHIRFVVTNAGNVNIKVYTLSGTFVKELVNQYFDIGVYGIGGNYPLSWDGRNANGNLVASGVYLISTEMAGGHQEFQKIAVIK